ncbi:hypothetical protein [Nocardioides sp. Root190]|nr:hypothetical protein [Nocardioides sp. Root190]
MTTTVAATIPTGSGVHPSAADLRLALRNELLHLVSDGPRR